MAHSKTRKAPVKKVVDLADLDVGKKANEGVEIELLHPVNRTPLGIWVTVIGMDSEQYKERNMENRNKRLQSMNQGLRISMTAQELDVEGLNMLVDCTTGFREMVLDGEAVEYSPANARKIYKRFSWIKDQVDTAIGDVANFL